MDTERTKPGLFAHLWCPVPEQPSGAYQVAAWTIRAAGILLAFPVLLPFLETIRQSGGRLPFSGGLPQAWGWTFLLVFVLGSLSILGWAGVMSYFASYTLFHWAKMDAQGRKYSAYLGEWLFFVGGAQAYFGIVSLTQDRKTISSTATNVLALAEFFLGIVLLVARMRPTAKALFHPPPSVHAFLEG